MYSYTFSYHELGFVVYSHSKIKYNLTCTNDKKMILYYHALHPCNEIQGLLWEIPSKLVKTLSASVFVSLINFHHKSIIIIKLIQTTDKCVTCSHVR